MQNDIELDILRQQFPKSVITCTHDFLGGTTPEQKGFVPNDHDGSYIHVLGHYDTRFANKLPAILKTVDKVNYELLKGDLHFYMMQLR